MAENTKPEGRLAVDIGGTFTDVVFDIRGRRTSTKVLTTPTAPADGVLTGLERVLALAGATPADVSVVLHGTTLATNALIERRGAKTALVTTEGHRDVLEMAFENRFEQYDINIGRPAPLVPRRLRLTVPERMNAAGEVLTPLDIDAVREVAQTLEKEQVESVAVGFLHGYANPEHELRTRDELARAMPDLSITLASGVCPEIREFERFSTACANAYVRPLMSRYLKDMASRLAALGVNCPFLMMTSGGGLTSVASAREYPIRLVESGPAGGAILAAHMARELGIERAVSFDMGGTTAKICLIDAGQPLLSRSFEVDRSYRFKRGSGLPVRIPVIEMVEIGAGGGSIASVDALGRIHVGPESAGSSPGPASYGRGGEHPTVTDADLLLGRLDAESFAGGRLPLDEKAAQKVLAEHVGGRIPELADVRHSAYAVSEVVDENMAAAARAHASEWGKELAGRTLIVMGGAAPIHAARLMQKLDIDAVLVPRDAGVGSAVGFLVAPISYEVVRSRYMRLGEFRAGLIADVMADMRQEALGVLGETAQGELRERRRAYMRYVGQGYEIAVELAADMDQESLRAAFEAAYRELYGRVIPGLDAEVLSWTLTLETPPHEEALEPPDLGRDEAGLADAPLFDGEGEVPAARLKRDSLALGTSVSGPAAIVEEQTTLVVPKRFLVQVTERGDLLLRKLRRDAAVAQDAPSSSAGIEP